MYLGYYKENKKFLVKTNLKKPSSLTESFWEIAKTLNLESKGR